MFIITAINKAVNSGRCMHMMHYGPFRTGIRNWLRDYDKIQSAAVLLIYLQIVCALIGSLGAFYGGVLLVHLGIALFALVAIESSSQSLGRTYAVLLLSAVLLDVFWFILFSREIWNISPKDYGASVIFSVKLYNSVLQEADTDLQNSFLSPKNPSIHRHPFGSDDALGGSVYDPAYYYSLTGDGRDEKYLSVLNQNHGRGVRSTPSPERNGPVKPVISRSVQGKNDYQKWCGAAIHYFRLLVQPRPVPSGGSASG